MCGIFCYVSSDTTVTLNENKILDKCRELLDHRGPDLSQQLLTDSRILFYGTVLWHQGETLCQQPLETDNTVLLFNGDIFLPRDNLVECDTQWLLRQLDQCDDRSQLCSLFGSLHGPYSIVFLRKRERRLYFARDSIGRNSLLFGRTNDGLFLTSVSGLVDTIEVQEVLPQGLYYVDLNSQKLGLLSWNEQINSVDSITQQLLEYNHNIHLSWFHEEIVPGEYNFHELLHEGTDCEDVYDYLLSHAAVRGVCEELLARLRNSVRDRVTVTTKACRQCVLTHAECTHPKVGILFSGGIDCTILALLAEEFVPATCSIDLLNVAFEKVVRSSKSPQTANDIDWNVPDRITGRSTLEELTTLRPMRRWNFVEINVTRRELHEHQAHISSLVYPLRTVLDESLGGALWFASRGIGYAAEEAYRSTCRVMILGSGADELFGGYSRHRQAFAKSKPTGTDGMATAYADLQQELNYDWDRLPSRNLARDDRIISDNGTTPRTPYLEERFVSFVRQLKASQLCYHPLGEGIGDKLLLRLCGYLLGLKQCSRFRKRALQFGSRIADRKQNANDRSEFLCGL